MTRPHVSVYIGISQDGFIARTDGSIDWLTDDRYTISGEDYGYQAFFDTIDTIIMGRATFETVMNFEPWPYEGKRLLVLSSQVELPETFRDKATVLSGSAVEVLNAARDRGAKRIYVDGGKTIQHFLHDGLVDDLTITRLPILIGSGIPLFGALPTDVHLRHLETRTFANGLVQSRYTVVRS